jgi:hypothetical protein
MRGNWSALRCHPGRLARTAALVVGAGGALLITGVQSASASTVGAGCQPYQHNGCLFPFPDNRLTVKDKQSVTGLRLKLPASAMPTNANNVKLSPAPFDLRDGFSAGSSVLIHIPQLDSAKAMTRTDPVGVLKMSAYKDKKAPIMVINEKTGKRQIIYTELDQNATSNAQRDLMIIPGSSWQDGQTYIVVLRNLKNSSGRAIKAPAWFRPFLKGKQLTRKDLPAAQRAQYGRYVAIFKALKRAGVSRSASLYATWNFTVSSAKNVTGKMLGIRNSAFKQLGDTKLSSGKVTGTAPQFTAESPVSQSFPATANFPDGSTGTVVTGTFSVPCYLAQCGASAGSGFSYHGKQGLYSVPVQKSGNVGTAAFECVIPQTATPATPARISLYGHGLLGDMSEVASTPQLELAAAHNIVMCATNWWGLAAPDMSFDSNAILNLNQFPIVVDRLQQGVLNTLLLGRLMDNPSGFASSSAFQQDGKSVLNTGELYYDGNSQGGIMGGVATAVSPDIRRAVLGVTGEDYGNMLVARSTDFGSPTQGGSFSWLLYGSYASQDASLYPMMLDLMDQQWDSADPDGYVEGLGAKTLPDTPSHSVLMDIAYGDHQVSMYAGAAEARALGADAYEPKGTSASALTPTGPIPSADKATYTAGEVDRQVNDNLFYGLSPAPLNGKYKGSVIEVWDSGPGHTWNPPVGDIPPATTSLNQDPHSDPRQTPLAQAQISDFLKPSGTFVNVCDGPCHSSDYTPLP